MSVLQRLNLKNVRLCVVKHKNLCYQLQHCALLNNEKRDNIFGNNRRYFSFQSTAESIAKTQTSIFKFLSESTPVEYCQNFLLSVHEVSGLPWWATIVASTVLVRTCVTVPLAIYQYNIVAKLENIKLEMDGVAKELKKETDVAVRLYKWDEKTAKLAFRRSIKKQWNNRIIRDNCHPFKTTLLFWFQIPLWVSISISLRNLVYMLPKEDFDAKMTYTELSVGGFGWIPNLIEVDSSLILPVTFGLINLMIIEMQTLSRIKVPTKLQTYLTNFFRAFSIFMVPVAASVPSCLVLYWTTSSAFGLIQNLILLSPKVKRACKISKTPSELEKPYQHIILGLKQKWPSIFKIS